MTTLNNRRRFIKQISATIASGLAIPAFATESPYFQATDRRLANLTGTSQDEKFWEMVKNQFNIPDGLIMVNSANLCPSPNVVNRRVAHFFKLMQENVSFQSRSQFNEIRENVIRLVADFIGAKEHEVGITRNTTEGNNLIVNGLNLKKGDEVIVWDQNHPSCRESWENMALRKGFTVKRISVPSGPEQIEDLVQPFDNAITSRTRILAFSHISNVSGIKLPVKQICALAREKGILTLIDGAQALGFLDMDLHEIDCDFYTASTHKWLMGPFENGILYIHERSVDKVWPDSITVGWNPEIRSVDGKFCSFGQRDETSTPAIEDIIEFHQLIGKKNIEARIIEMNTYLKSKISEEIPDAEFVTPFEEELSGGVTIFRIPGKDPAQLFSNLYEKFGIACAPTGGVRLSPTICATLKDMDYIVEAVRELATA